MRVEIVSVGDEVLLGGVVDTNSGYIAQQCEILGFEVRRHHCVGDDLKQLTDVLLEVGQRADIAIVSGGLGPTPDDLSREAAAAACHVELVQYPEALSALEAFFQKLSRTMPEANKKQTLFPKGAIYLPNILGTAPGFTLNIGQAQCFFIPGVPREMRHMLNEQVFPFINNNMDCMTLERLNVNTISTFGISEAVIGKLLSDIKTGFPTIKFGTRANFPVIFVNTSLRGSDEATKHSIASATEKVMGQLSDFVYSLDETSMEQIVSKLLAEFNISLCITECQTGGVLADLLTNDTQASDKLSSYCVVNHQILKEICQGISTPVEIAQEIAIKHFNINKPTYSIAVYAAPDESTAKRLSVNVGDVFIVVSDGAHMDIYECNLPYGGSDYKRKIFAVLTLDIIRRKILNLSPLDEVLGKKLTFSTQTY